MTKWEPKILVCWGNHQSCLQVSGTYGLTGMVHPYILEWAEVYCLDSI